MEEQYIEEEETQSCKSLNMKDALSYLDDVRKQFSDKSEVYEEFLVIMKDFKGQSIGTPEVISRVSTLFAGYPGLIKEFNRFLPPGYRMELSMDEVRVITPETNLNKRRMEDAMDKKYVKKKKKEERKSIRFEEKSEETELFERIKKRLDSAHVFNEFLKVLHLYSEDVISIEVLLRRVHGFLSQRAPDLFRAFYDLVNRKWNTGIQGPVTLKFSERNMAGVHMAQATLEPFTGFSKYNNAQGMETWKQIGPSYRKIKKDIRVGTCSGRDQLCKLVLNDEYVSHPPTHSDANGEDQLNVHRKNLHEEQMSRVEEERYEFDVNIEANASCIRLLEPILQKLNLMKEEEKRNFKLPESLLSSAPSIHQRILKKLYGENYSHVMESLCSNPMVSCPVVLKRLKQKDEEWRRQKREFSRVWRESDLKHYYKALDFQGTALKQTEKKFQIKSLLQEIEACFLEYKERKLLVNCVPRYHMEFLMDDKLVLKDVFHILLQMNDQNFDSCSGFLESFFYSTLKPSKLQSNNSVVCFGNNNIYLIFRLIQMMYQRLVLLRQKSDENLKSKNKVAEDLNFIHEQPRLQTDDLYATALKYILNYLKLDTDQQQFEEQMRMLFGTTAYVVFYIDKTVQACLRQLRECVQCPSTINAMDLFQSYSQPMTYHQESLYRMCIEDQVASTDHLYRFEIGRYLCIQLLSPNDFHSESQNKWNNYIEEYTGPSEKSQRLPFLVRSLKRKNEVLFSNCGLQLKICVNTYRLFYLMDTEDFFFKNQTQHNSPKTYEPTMDDKKCKDWFMGLDPIRQNFKTTKNEKFYLCEFISDSSV